MSAARFSPLDFDDFHRTDLPARTASPAALRGLSPIAFRVGSASYTYVAAGDRLEVVPGDEGARAVVELDADAWSDFVRELRTSFALLYAGDLRMARGGFGHLARWEPALRHVFDGQAVWDPADPPVVDADPTVSFTLDDGDDVLRAFLDATGFVHLRGVFTPDEVAALAADVDDAVARARPDDLRSWWTTVDGLDACNRVNYLNQQSARIAALDDDPRLARIGALGGPDLRPCGDRLDGHNVVIKVPGASTGLADLPWHRDCGMGGHPVKCPMLNVGIQLDAATAAAGQLHVIPGSHLGTSGIPSDADVASVPKVALTTLPGDVTVHWGHTLHAAPPPADRSAAGRRAIYVTFVPPLTFEMVGPGQGYNDVLFARGEGHVRHVAEL